MPTAGKVARLPKGVSAVPNPKALQAVRNAKLALGTPYVYGGTQFHKGIDCSGLCYVAYRMAGVSIPRTTYTMYAAGWSKVAHGQEIPGDLIFSYPDEGGVPGPGHVVMSIGNGQVIAADHSGTVVHIEPASTFNDVYVGSRRPLLATGQIDTGQVFGGSSVTGDISGAASAVSNAFSILGDWNTWLRLGKLLAGAILVVVGFLLVAKKPVMSTVGM
jgi:hypothetical protein